VGFVVDKVVVGQALLQSPSVFSLSISFHHGSLFTHVLSAGWTKVPLEAQFHPTATITINTLFDISRL
jgi:hypothetical protein